MSRTSILLTVLCLVHTSVQQDCLECVDFLNLEEYQTSSGAKACADTLFYNDARDYYTCNFDFACKGLQNWPDFTKLCHTYTVSETLEIEDSDISDIRAGAFDNIEVVSDKSEFTIKNCGVSSIAEGAFGDSNIPEKLHKLDLASNKLTSINALLVLYNLVELNLEDNLLSSLPSNMHLKLTKLTNIYLRKNAFTTVPDNICKFPSMVGIGLGYNDITGDLSEYIDTFAQCNSDSDGVDIRWPQSTMTCTCKVLYKYPSDSSEFKIYADCDNSICDGTPVVCDPNSYEEFVGEKLRKLEVADIWQKCPKTDGWNKTSEAVGKQSWLWGLMAAVVLLT